MSRVSTRYAIPLIVILLCGLGLSLNYRRVGGTVDDCAHPSALYDVGSIEGSVPEVERWDMHDELRLQVSRGTVPVPIAGVDPLSFSMRRNRDPKRLYRSPRSFMSELGFVDWSAVEWLPSSTGEIAIHVAYGHSDDEIQLGLHLSILDGRAIDSVMREQMLSAPRQLLTGSTPFTLVTISGSVPPQHFDVVNEFAKQWLVSAWEFYAAVCEP